MALWVTPSSSAARVNERWRATASNAISGRKGGRRRIIGQVLARMISIHARLRNDHSPLRNVVRHDGGMPNASSTNRTRASRPPAPQTAAASQPANGALAALVAACVSGFLFQLDLTALSAALPDIATSLSAVVADQAWVIDVYSLALIFALPLAGPAADRYGRRRAFMSGAILFALASALCATTTTFFGLLAWRVLQGISGAALTASASALLAAAYPGPRRAWAFGIWGTVIGASMVAGPPLGALIAAVLGWSWVFWI